jgi:hypothetical protein
MYEDLKHIYNPENFKVLYLTMFILGAKGLPSKQGSKGNMYVESKWSNSTEEKKSYLHAFNEFFVIDCLDDEGCHL